MFNVDKKKTEDFKPLTHTQLLGLMGQIGDGHEAKKTLRGKIKLADNEVPLENDAKKVLRDKTERKDQIIAKLVRKEIDPATIEPELQIDSKHLSSLIDTIRQSNRAKEVIINAFAKRAAAIVWQYWKGTQPSEIGPNTAHNMVMASL